MAAEFVPVEPFDLVIFGGTGDLAARKLLPALYHRDQDGQLSADSRIIGASRSELSDEDYINWVHDALSRYMREGAPEGDVWARFSKRLRYASVDAKDAASWEGLRTALERHDDRNRIFYLATASSLYGPIAEQLDAQNLANKQARIVLEKPVGHDFDSACRVNDAVGAVFEESRIFRIDHYLGKETVQNLLALRFGNAMFEPLWQRNVIDHVQITVAEDIGVDNRFEFYEQTGALRDMMQNHMLQVLCMVAMEPPASMHHDDIRNEKMKVLRALRPITRERVREFTVRGQYSAGMVGGEPVPAYGSSTPCEAKPDERPHAETFVAIKAELDSWRWRGTPFYLRTGKRMAEKSSKIVLQFKPVPHSIFGDQTLEPNRLILSLQPEEGVRVTMMTKQPGPGGFRLKSVPLNLSFPDAFSVHYPDAYERLLMEVLRGNPALFMRRDEIETAWRWIDQILDNWKAENVRPQQYMAGSWGPANSFLMVDRDHRTWHDVE